MKSNIFLKLNYFLLVVMVLSLIYKLGHSIYTQEPSMLFFISLIVVVLTLLLSNFNPSLVYLFGILILLFVIGILFDPGKGIYHVIYLIGFYMLAITDIAFIGVMVWLFWSSNTADKSEINN